MFLSLENSGHESPLRKGEFAKMYFKVAVRFFSSSLLFFFGVSLPILRHSIKEVVTEDGEIDFRMRDLTFSSALLVCVGWMAVRLGANRFRLYILLWCQNQVRKPARWNLTQRGHYSRQATP